MYLKCHRRLKDGKEHRYWSIAEKRRLRRGRVVDRHVLYLGEINDSQRESWLKSIATFDEHRQEQRRLALFPADRQIPEHARECGVQVRLSEMRLKRPRQWGACRAFCRLWEQLRLDEFWGERLKDSLEQSRQQLAEFESQRSAPQDLAPLESTISLSLEVYYRISDRYPYKWHPDKTVEVSWRDLFGRIAIKLLAPTNDDTLNHAIAEEISATVSSEKRRQICQRDWETVKAQFLALAYVTITYGTTTMNTGALFWNLTELGKKVGLLLRSVRNTPLA